MSPKAFLRSFYRSFRLSLRYPVSMRFRVMKDYLSLYRIKGLTTEEYNDFEFDNRDDVFRLSFLGLNEQRYYIDYLNPVKYYSLARNKYFAHKMLENTGVRQAELYCYYQPEARYISESGVASDLNGVLGILKQKDVQSCVIKMTEGSHGDSVWVIKNIKYQDGDAILSRFDGQEVLLSSMLGGDALIFESVVYQTKQFSAFNDSSVNTVRFMTTLWPDGSAKVIATWFKVGRAGRCVDNAGSGGNVDAAVDVETGRIYNVVEFNGWRKTKEIECHPDSGTRIDGVIIENWQAIKDEVQRFQQCFPYCKAAGWDIAITDDGPVVVEVNDFWDRTGQYFIKKGWRKEIRDCYLAWKKTGKEYTMFRQPNELNHNHLVQITEHE